MAAPFKPWEGANLNSSAGPQISNYENLGGMQPSITPTVQPTPSLPPTLNPRIVANIRSPGQQMVSYPSTSLGYSSYGGGMAGGYGSSYGMPYGGGYSSYSSGYGGYGNSGYGGYGGYSSYGSPYGGAGYGAGYGYGMQQPGVENRFIQIAEESARPTFQTIESVVRTFSSMGAMLDQTFFAMTSSFRAILSVADSFGRLRSMMGHMWTSFALFKAINWLLRKLMSILRIYDNQNAQDQETLNTAFSNVLGNEGLNQSNPSKWPIAVFLGIIVSAPYIVYKLFAQNIEESLAGNADLDGNLVFRRVPATYSFSAKNEHEISFVAGEMLSIYPDEIQQRNGLVRTGWVLAKNNKGQKGVIPVNYLFENKSG